MQPVYGFASGGPLRFKRAVGHRDLFYIDDKDVDLKDVSNYCILIAPNAFNLDMVKKHAKFLKPIHLRLLKLHYQKHHLMPQLLATGLLLMVYSLLFQKMLL